MRNKLTVLAAIVSLSCIALPQNAQAERASKQETVGVGAGAIVGAAAGGPVGFIIGAAIGAKIGDSFHQREEQVVALESSLVETRIAATRLQDDVSDLNQEIAALQDVARPELVELMQAGIDMDLLFRTDEYALADSTHARLQSLAASLANMPDVRIQLDGFADERGATNYNFVLSEKRVTFVRDLFVAAGVHPTRIVTVAHGESATPEATIDNFALQRRVSVKLFIDGTAIASNQIR